jgi:hypothetical protein
VVKVGTGGILKEKLSKFLKLVEISIVITLGLVKGKWTFSTLTYIKNKLRNYLIVHLDMVIRMYA